MNTNFIRRLFWGLAFLGPLSGCSSGDINFPGVDTVVPRGPAGTIQLTDISFQVAEGAMVNVYVNRSGGSSGAVSVDFATADVTAEGGLDYTMVSGTLYWSSGQTGNKTISIPIMDDDSAEGSESFTVTLSNVAWAALGANSQATVTIVDNDAAAITAFGAITELKDITVNGIRYDTSATSVYVNGLPASVSDLRLGQVVALEGEVNLSNSTGVADQIDYSATVIGPVEHIDAALSRLTVMGQTVLTDSDTVFDPIIDPNTFAGISAGSNVQVSGFLDGEGQIVATRIEPDSASAGVQVIGGVAGLDQARMSFTLNWLTIDYHAAALIDLPNGMPTNGMFVIARGSLTDGVLIVSEITSLHDSAGNTPGELAQVQGSITSYESARDFALNGHPVTTDATTELAGGTIDDLQSSAKVTVDGEFSGNGSTIVAAKIAFGRGR